MKILSCNKNTLSHENEKDADALGTMKERGGLEVTKILRSLDLMSKVKM